MGRLGFLSANAAIFFLFLFSVSLALSLGIYHTYTSCENYELMLEEGVDKVGLARSKVLLEGGGSFGIVFVVFCFYLLNGWMHPRSYRGLKLTSRDYWFYLALVTFCSLPWSFALFGVFLSDHLPLFLGRQDFEGFPAVHLGTHHGLYGYLACATIPVGFKIVGRFRFKPLKGLLGLAMFTGYVAGFYLFLQDFVREQFFKSLPSLPPNPFSPSWSSSGLHTGFTGSEKVFGPANI